MRKKAIVTLIAIATVSTALVSNSFSQSKSDELKKHDIGMLMYLCGYKEPNRKKFMKNATSEQIDCMFSNIQKLKDMESEVENKELAKKQAYERIKSTDCQSITDLLLRDICLALK